MNSNAVQICADLAKELNLPTGTIITAVPPSISPVYPINKKYTDTVWASSRSTTGSGTLLATSGDREFYLTYARLSYVCDNAFDGQYVEINITVGGSVKGLLRLYPTALTAQNEHSELTFPFPIKVDRGTTITYGGTFAAGTATISAAIGGFYL